MKNKPTQKNIPNGWQQVKLGDCLVIKHGKPQKGIEVINGQYPILATGGIIGRTNTPLYSKPSVLIGRKGTIDKPSYMDTPFWTVDTLFYSQIKENSVPKYLFYKFNTINWYDFNEASGVPSLSATTISSIKLNLPPISEQKRIVTVLEIWDKALEKLSQKIEAKGQIKKSLMQDLLTGKKRFSGFTEKWKAVEIGNFCDIKRGGSPRPIRDYMTEESDGLNWLKIGDVPKGSRFIFKTTGKIKKEGLNMTTLVNDGDFILSNSMSFGRPYIMKLSACIHDGWLALKDISPEVSKDFLYYLLSSEIVQAKFRSISAGSGVLNLKKETVSKVVLQIPSLSEQKRIAQLLTAADDEIDKLEQKLSVLTIQKNYLLNNLITGTIRTPEKLSTHN